MVKPYAMGPLRLAAMGHIRRGVRRLCNSVEIVVLCPRNSCSIEICLGAHKEKYSSPLFWCSTWQMEKWVVRHYSVSYGRCMKCELHDGKYQWGPWVSMQKDCESHLRLTNKLHLCAVFSLKLCNHTYLLYFIRSDSCQYLSGSWSTDMSRTLSVSDNTQQNLKQVSGHLESN